jgi:hypothetical protein
MAAQGDVADISKEESPTDNMEMIDPRPTTPFVTSVGTWREELMPVEIVRPRMKSAEIATESVTLREHVDRRRTSVL